MPLMLCCTNLRGQSVRILILLYAHTGFLNDFYAFNPVNMTWTKLSSLVRGALPSPRCSFGFASAGEKIFVFGGEAAEGHILHRISAFKLTRLDSILLIFFKNN
jgi:N-acetylneuraminic acid mutarotase